MVSTEKALGLSPEIRAGIFHFTVFASTGVASAYFGIWLTQRGIAPDEIGIINAAPVLLMLCINVLVGRLADKASDWRQVIIILSLIAGSVPVGLWFVEGFWGILLVWTLAVVPATALVPVIDAATLRMTERRGANFGAVRAWGTVGYGVVTALSGPIIMAFGEAAFVPLFVAWSALRALLSLQLPRFRAPPHEARPLAEKPRAARLMEVLKPWFVLPLVGLGMHYSIHIVLASFGALLWKQQGISEALIGPLIGIMAAAEALMMFLWQRLNLKVSARSLIIFAALVAAARWGIMAFEPPVYVLFFLQLLHAITFAVAYFGGIYFIANWTSEDIAAEAQGFSYLLQQGFAVISLVVFGWLVALFGAKAWLFASAMALGGAALVLISLRLRSATATPKVERVV
jgi:MFS transporter, PPP family, 3-phenylpropionic acid transporter